IAAPSIPSACRAPTPTLSRSPSPSPHAQHEGGAAGSLEPVVSLTAADGSELPSGHPVEETPIPPPAVMVTSRAASGSAVSIRWNGVSAEKGVHAYTNV